jgi:hypothetical protein
MAGQYYIYLPFNSSNLKELAEVWQRSIRSYIYEKIRAEVSPEPLHKEIEARIPTHPDYRKVPIVCVHGDEKSLYTLRDDIGAHDVLYILVHGVMALRHDVVVQASVIPTIVSDGEGQDLTAEQLVTRMVGDKVPDRVLRMKLYSCSGGAGNESFAKTMRLAMNKPFPHSDLYAYTRIVTADRALLTDPITGHFDAHRASQELRGNWFSNLGRASDSRIRLARPLSFDEISEVDRAVYEDLIAGIDAVDRIFTRAAQMALTSTASALATRIRADQKEDAIRPKRAAQSEK